MNVEFRSCEETRDVPELYITAAEFLKAEKDGLQNSSLYYAVSAFLSYVNGRENMHTSGFNIINGFNIDQYTFIRQYIKDSSSAIIIKGASTTEPPYIVPSVTVITNNKPQPVPLENCRRIHPYEVEVAY